MNLVLQSVKPILQQSICSGMNQLFDRSSDKLIAILENSLKEQLKNSPELIESSIKRIVDTVEKIVIEKINAAQDKMNVAAQNVQDKMSVAAQNVQDKINVAAQNMSQRRGGGKRYCRRKTKYYIGQANYRRSKKTQKPLK